MSEDLVFERPASLTLAHTNYCPGCTHGIIHRLVAESIDELGLAPRTIGVAPVGCSVLCYNYFDVDFVEAPHGRAPAVATGVKRADPSRFVFTYQGDGDLAAIGTSEVIHAANRGENLTVVFVNNTTYGMTGGQMAPTTMLGQKTTTSPHGRSATRDGHPIRMAELLGSLPGTAYAARVATASPGQMKTARKAIFRAFQAQLEGRGFSVVELLSTCPTNWGMNPVEAQRHVREEMTREFPLGVTKDWKDA